MKEYVGTRLTLDDVTFEVVATQHLGGDLMVIVEEVGSKSQIPYRATLRLQDIGESLLPA
jgi:hypothetical protein